MARIPCAEYLNEEQVDYELMIRNIYTREVTKMDLSSKQKLLRFLFKKDGKNWLNYGSPYSISQEYDYIQENVFSMNCALLSTDSQPKLVFENQLLHYWYRTERTMALTEDEMKQKKNLLWEIEACLMELEIKPPSKPTVGSEVLASDDKVSPENQIRAEQLKRLERLEEMVSSLVLLVAELTDNQSTQNQHQQLDNQLHNQQHLNSKHSNHLNDQTDKIFNSNQNNPNQLYNHHETNNIKLDSKEHLNSNKEHNFHKQHNNQQLNNQNQLNNKPRNNNIQDKNLKQLNNQKELNNLMQTNNKHQLKNSIQLNNQTEQNNQQQINDQQTNYQQFNVQQPKSEHDRPIPKGRFRWQVRRNRWFSNTSLDQSEKHHKWKPSGDINLAKSYHCRFVHSNRGKDQLSQPFDYDPRGNDRWDFEGRKNWILKRKSA